MGTAAGPVVRTLQSILARCRSAAPSLEAALAAVSSGVPLAARPSPQAHSFVPALSALRLPHARPFSAASGAAQEVETRQAWRPAQVSDADAQGASDSAPAEGGRSAAPASGVSSLPEMDQVFKMLQDLGLQPGRNCVVGEGLATVDVGLYLQGVKVALEMEENPAVATLETDAKAFAMQRAMRGLLKAHGWHSVTLAASEWRRLETEDLREAYLAHSINEALGGGKGHHHHHHGHGGCGSGCGHDHQKDHAPEHSHGHDHEHEHGGGNGSCGSHKHEHGDAHDHEHGGKGSCGHNHH